MSVHQEATPVFRALLEEAKRSIAVANRSAAIITRADAIEAMRAAKQELATELAGKAAAQIHPQDVLDEIEIVEDEDVLETAQELHPKKTSLLDLQLAAPMALPTDWDDGPFGSEDVRIDPPWAANQ